MFFSFPHIAIDSDGGWPPLPPLAAAAAAASVKTIYPTIRLEPPNPPLVRRQRGWHLPPQPPRRLLRLRRPHRLHQVCSRFSPSLHCVCAVCMRAAALLECAGPAALPSSAPLRAAGGAARHCSTHAQSGRRVLDEHTQPTFQFAPGPAAKHPASLHSKHCSESKLSPPHPTHPPHTPPPPPTPPPTTSPPHTHTAAT